MGRLFTSIVDRHLYGDAFVDHMVQFYNKVDVIEKANRIDIPIGIQLVDTFGFLLEDKNAVGIEFNDKCDLPQELMGEIFKAFQEEFQGKS